MKCQTIFRKTQYPMFKLLTENNSQIILRENKMPGKTRRQKSTLSTWPSSVVIAHQTSSCYQTTTRYLRIRCHRHMILSIHRCRRRKSKPECRKRHQRSCHTRWRADSYPWGRGKLKSMCRSIATWSPMMSERASLANHFIKPCVFEQHYHINKYYLIRLC